MFQTITVYILIFVALGGLGRYIYRKLKALKKGKESEACDTCPLKKSCEVKTKERKKAANTCCPSDSCGES